MDRCTCNSTASITPCCLHFIVHVEGLLKDLAELQQAAEAKRERELKSIKFTQGKRAYSTGQYDASMVLFQDALEQEGDLSPLGGEIQLWLALAYQVPLHASSAAACLGGWCANASRCCHCRANDSSLRPISTVWSGQRDTYKGGVQK